MPLSVPSSNGGSGLAGLLRQSRPVKTDNAGSAPTSEPSTTVSVRPVGRSGIDSTQRGTAQISAALTVYLSKLGGSDDASPSAAKAVGATSGSRDDGPGTPTSTGAGLPRSGAAELLRTLDAHRAKMPALRLTA